MQSLGNSRRIQLPSLTHTELFSLSRQTRLLRLSIETSALVAPPHAMGPNHVDGVPTSKFGGVVPAVSYDTSVTAADQVRFGIRLRRELSWFVLHQMSFEFHLDPIQLHLRKPEYRFQQRVGLSPGNQRSKPRCVSVADIGDWKCQRLPRVNHFAISLVEWSS